LSTDIDICRSTKFRIRSGEASSATRGAIFCVTSSKSDAPMNASLQTKQSRRVSRRGTSRRSDIIKRASERHELLQSFELAQERRGQEYGFSGSRDRQLPRESTASDRYALTNRSANGAAMTGRSMLADGLPVPHFAL
jgi:hypothetical protein